MSYQLMFQKAVELHQSGAFNEAEKIYRQILETAPENADVLNLIGLIAQNKGLHKEASEYFYRAIKSAPQHFPIYFNLAVSLGALGKYIEALEAYEKVVKLSPDCKEAYFGMGNLYWAQNNLTAAKSSFGEALKIDPYYIQAKTNLAEIEDNLELLFSMSDNNPQALYYLGRRCFNNHEFNKAAEYLSKADKIADDDEVKSILAEALLALDQKEKALRYFYQAVHINKNNFSASINIADLETELNNFKEAEKFYKKALEIDRNSLRAHANYANMLCKNRRTLEALEEYRQAIIISPETPELSYNLALILKSLEEYEQALDLMFYAFYLDTSKTAWGLNIAETLVLFNEKAPEKARKIADNWYEKMPDNIVAKHLWYSLNQKTSDVESEYNKLLFDTFAPSYEITLKNIGYQVIDKIAELYKPIKGKILDIGCGTGLVGEKLADSDNEFYGVDISQNMLNIAEKKGKYIKLIKKDILEYLDGEYPAFDYAIAADVLCYFGNLKEIFTKCRAANIIFSLEEDSQIKTYSLQPNGRYKHNLEYISEILKESGYTNVNINTLVLRQENGKAIKGAIINASKPFSLYTK